MTIETEGGRGRINRLEDPALLCGKGRFIDDIERAEMLEAAFVRSPFGHAEIRGIDTTAARELPGVHAVLTRDDIRPYLRNEYLVVGLPSKLYKQNRNRPEHMGRRGKHRPLPLRRRRKKCSVRFPNTPGIPRC